MTYTNRQRLFAAAWQSIDGSDDLSRGERMDLRFNAMESEDLAEVYMDLTGFAPSAGEVTTDLWALGKKGIRAKLYGGAIRGHAGPAHPVYRSILALNDAVVTLVNRQLEKPYMAITDSVRERLGLWGLAPQPGSVILELVAPPADFGEARRPHAGLSDSPFPGLEHLETPAERSIDELFSVLTAVKEFRDQPLQLEDKLVELGADATKSLDRFAQRCSEIGVTVDLDDRTPRGAALVFKPDDAKYLHRTIKTLRLDEDLKIVEGMWRTASLERRIFDLIVEHQDGPNERLSGIVPKTLMSASADAFNKYVEVEFREYRRGGEEGSLRRVLEKITILRPGAPRAAER
ncbi:hypothetical protein [Arthrobacter ramosus]|uniref:Uncharacterized protein n=1 Tax=Arthrobacter ramosus TaxID=1672 RepID=A0ABV5Y6W9_ARTRM|nr:hypothetical protein [Arthrobacter ramosus]